jgi:L-2,4-diaminobutyric acid acetyltransferase
MKGGQGSSENEDSSGLKLRNPRLDDGAGISALIETCKPLDTNSTYCYLLLCRDFAKTCVVAEEEGEIIAFLSGYRPPDRREVFFLWQVAVDIGSRKRGIGKRMLREVLNRPSTRDCRFLETTISPSNEASKRLFSWLARELKAQCDVALCFSESQFRDFDHEAEYLFRIGPFDLNG